MKVRSEKQFGISFKGTLKNIFKNKGYFGDFSRENGSTDPLGAFLIIKVSLFDGATHYCQLDLIAEILTEYYPASLKISFEFSFF